MKIHLFLLALSIGVLSIPVTAQDGKPPAGGTSGDNQRRQGGSGDQSQGQSCPIIEALDLNKDGTIDANEIAMAAESLKQLDKNGDGKITEDEYAHRRSNGLRQIRPRGGDPRPSPPISER